jgi:hypothetical protein
MKLLQVISWPVPPHWSACNQDRSCGYCPQAQVAGGPAGRTLFPWAGVATCPERTCPFRMIDSAQGRGVRSDCDLTAEGPLRPVLQP